jgi:hypothetical protein
MQIQFCSFDIRVIGFVTIAVVFFFVFIVIISNSLTVEARWEALAIAAGII